MAEGIQLRIVPTAGYGDRKLGMMWRRPSEDTPDRECWVMKNGEAIREGSYWHGWIKDGMIV
jgi:hypothetical protein